MLNIALVEDDKDLAATIIEYLENNNYKINHFENGLPFIDELKLNSYDLIILDLMMSNMGGFEILDYLKTINSKVPIIVISGLLDVDNLENAFNLGAVDYIKKPVHLRELLIRIKRFDSLLNRFLICKDTYFDMSDKTLLKGEEEIKLTAKQASILALFCKFPDQVLNYDFIEVSVWGTHGEVKLNTLSTYIKDLNKIIFPSNIKNISKVGYRFLVNS